MAIFHATARPLQRSKGASASGLGAYMTDRDIRDPYDGTLYKQRDRHDHDMTVFSVFPDNTAGDFFGSPAEAFMAVDRFEKRKDATLGAEWEIALPEELDREQAEDAIRNWAADWADDDGRYCVVACHWKDGNHHAHIWITDRAISRDADGNVTWGKKDNDPARNKERLIHYREAWRDYANIFLEEAGHDVRIDHRTLKAQGIEREAQRKEGRNPRAEVVAHNARVKREMVADLNAERADRERELKTARDTERAAEVARFKAEMIADTAPAIEDIEDDHPVHDIMRSYIDKGLVKATPKRTPPGVGRLNAETVPDAPPKRLPPGAGKLPPKTLRDEDIARSGPPKRVGPPQPLQRPTPALKPKGWDMELG